MLRPRWRKVLRDLWNNKTRTILVVLSIAVGVFAVGMIASTQIILSNDLSASYAAINPASAVLYAAPFDEDLVQSVRRMEEIKEAEGRRVVTVRLKSGSGRWTDLDLTIIDNYHDIRLDKVRSERGAWPPPDREILIERASLHLIEVEEGETILIETADGEQHALRIAGLAHDLNNRPTYSFGMPYGYVTFDTLDWLGYPRYFDELHVLVAGNTADRQHVQTVVDRVRDKVERSGRTVYWTWVPEPGEHPSNNIVQSLLLILGVLGFLSLFASGFLVVNTISALLAQQVRQIGVMKAIGARNGQIVRMYLGAVLIFSLLSLIIAVPLAAVAAHLLTIYLAGLLNFDLAGFRLPFQILVLEISVGLIVPLLAALYPVISGVRITVREAISTYGLGKGEFGTNFLDRVLKQIRGLSRPVLLSLRNTFRRKLRLALTLVTLVLGGATFIAVFSVRTSLLTTFDDFMAYWQYDVRVNFDRAYPIELIEREAMRVPGVVNAEGWGETTVRRVRPDGHEGPNVLITAPPADTNLLQPNLIAGRWLLPTDENAVVLNSDVLRDEPGIQVGDEIVLKIEGRETRWRVVGIVQTEMSPGFGMGYVNYPYFARVIRSAGRADNVRIVGAEHDSAYQSSLITALEEHFDAVGLHVSSARTLTSVRENVEYQFNVLTIFLSIMAVLLAIVGGLGLMGTMSINVLERAREIGVMRAIGASDGSVLQIFIIEGLIIGALSWLVGLVLALPISKLLSDTVGYAFVDAPLNYAFSIAGASFWLVIALILGGLASFLPAWNAARLSVHQVLMYE